MKLYHWEAFKWVSRIYIRIIILKLLIASKGWWRKSKKVLTMLIEQNENITNSLMGRQKSLGLSLGREFFSQVSLSQVGFFMVADSINRLFQMCGRIWQVYKAVWGLVAWSPKRDMKEIFQKHWLKKKKREILSFFREER